MTIVFISDWVLVGEKTECRGSEIFKGKLPTVMNCATACKVTSSMFIYGTNDFGKDRCNTSGCSCYCETSATTKGTCDQKNHNGYRLYKYTF